MSGDGKALVDQQSQRVCSCALKNPNYCSSDCSSLCARHEGGSVMADFIWFQASIIASLCTIQYSTGLWVRHKGIKVNYTRKINHFALFFVPVFLRSVFPYEQSFVRFIMGCAIGTLILFIYIKPIRNKIPIIATMFLSFDRPEDRPNTVWWLFTQILASYIILVPAVIFFVQNGLAGLIWIPLLIVAFGDGLAEPVGVRFGRHKYATYAFFSKKKYVRTLEGSACVILASIIVVAVFHSSFTQLQFIIALIIIPLLMTFVEAFSPHTWDSPTLYLAGYGALYGITRLA
jgi:phytol kinase